MIEAFRLTSPLCSLVSMCGLSRDLCCTTRLGSEWITFLGIVAGYGILPGQVAAGPNILFLRKAAVAWEPRDNIAAHRSHLKIVTYRSRLFLSPTSFFLQFSFTHPTEKTTVEKRTRLSCALAFLSNDNMHTSTTAPHSQHQNEKRKIAWEVTRNMDINGFTKTSRVSLSIHDH